MPQIELHLDEDTLQRLQWRAERDGTTLDETIRAAIETYFVYDDPPKAELLADLKQALIDAINGNTIPIDDVLREFDEEFPDDEDESEGVVSVHDS